MISNAREQGVDVTIAKIITFRSAVPQHIRTSHVDPTLDVAIVGKGIGRVLTVYTGELEIQFQTDDDRGEFPFEYPLLGLFTDASNNFVPGIIPINTDTFFHGAVATVSLTDIVDKRNAAIWEVTQVRADLCEVDLNPSPETPPLAPKAIFAVVLRATLSGQQSIIGHVQYHVTVLSGLLEIPRLPVDPKISALKHFSMEQPILVGAPTWDGFYRKIGPILVPGVGNP